MAAMPELVAALMDNVLTLEAVLMPASTAAVVIALVSFVAVNVVPATAAAAARAAVEVAEKLIVILRRLTIAALPLQPVVHPAPVASPRAIP